MLSFMAFSKQSRPPGKQMTGQGCKPSRRRRAWPLPRGSLPRCLRELPPYVPSTSFQSRLLLTSFSWRDNSKKQGMFFFKNRVFQLCCWFLRKLWISGAQSTSCWWPPCGNLALPSLAICKCTFDLFLCSRAYPSSLLLPLAAFLWKFIGLTKMELRPG